MSSVKHALRGDVLDSQPLTLYLDLEPGKTVDLEVAARASIAWSRAIKEIGFILAPDAQFVVELRSGTEGSLGLNSLIRSVREIDPKYLKAIAVGVLLWFSNETASWMHGQLFDAIFGNANAEVTAPEGLSPEQFAALLRAIEQGAGKEHTKEVYRELERDPAIRGVGVTTAPGTRPRVIIPRDQFADRAGFGVTITESSVRRVRPARFEALLIKPVLIPGSQRRWRFQTSEGELGFVMGDDDFVTRILTGVDPLPMVSGIILDLAVSITEEFDGKVWVVKSRRIDHVLGYRRPDTVGRLPFATAEAEPDEDDD